MIEFLPIKALRVYRGGITETKGVIMLHDEAYELLVHRYEATHNMEGIAKAYSVSKRTLYRLSEKSIKWAALRYVSVSTTEN